MRTLINYLFVLLPFLVVAQIPTYYSDVDLNLSGTALKDELSSKVTTTHTTFLSYTPGVWDALKLSDLDPTDNTKVLLIYGYDDNDGDSKSDRSRSSSLNGGNVGDWNREHVFAKSLGNPNLGTSGPGADAHHLRPSDVQWNSDRSNRKFADGSGNAGIVGSFWYPGDEWKGDVARMVMYMYLRYGSTCLPINVGDGNALTVDSNMIDLFLQWNVDDPVSAFEDQRNPVLEGIQGNRNPFIDNPAFATEIWGGAQAEDRFNTTPDTEAPTVPTGLMASSISSNALILGWIASTDNVAVIEYEIHQDGILIDTASSLTYNVSGLSSNTTYAYTVYAKDAAGNTSLVSNTETVTTLSPDTQSPTAPTGLASSNITSSSLILSWTASTDNIAVADYDVYQDGLLIATTSNLIYDVSGLSPETIYAFTVYAKDTSGNISLVSNTETATTLAGSTSVSSELFLSEYIEGSSNNKSVEIANFTGSVIDLSIYSLKRDVNGGGSWGSTYTLSGTVADQDVFVVSNSSATQTILDASDLTTTSDALLFNGNDPVGLFKNDVLIDIIGVLGGGSSNFAANTTLRRKSSISEPSTTYDTLEWDSYTSDTFDGLGTHTIDGGSATDTEAPSTVANILVSNESETTIDLSWDASTDNVAVTDYDVYVNGVFSQSTTSTTAQVTGLTVVTSYSITVYAKDAVGNVSTVSSIITGTTVDLTAPTSPTSLLSASVTETGFNLSWTASTDNVAVIEYEIHQDGVLIVTTSGLSYSVSGLTPNTTYAYTVEAIDAAGNTSLVSNTETITTLSPDTQSPTAPTGLASSNITSSSLTLSWAASTDNIAVADYDVYQDGLLIATTSNLTYNVSGLSPETIYVFTVYAKDTSGNISLVSNTETATTLAGSTSVSSELFLSEYIEGSSNNKSLEIANFTGSVIDLSIYSLKRDVNGGGSWGSTYTLSGTVEDQDVFVVSNSSATQTILDASDLTTTSDALLFNGNDPVGLFKNDVLIDIIGVLGGGSSNFAANTTLRRKSSISEPSTTYDTLEWDSYASDTFDGLGTHTIDGGSASDTEAPSTVVNILVSNESETTIDLSWDASTDNVAVTEYDVYLDGVFSQSTTSATAQITGLEVVTSYSITVYAKDAVGNISTVSSVITGTTVDLTAPTAPTSLLSASITETGFDLSWTASTDNVAVTEYEIHQDGILIGTASSLTYNVSGLSSNTTYIYTVEAIDAAANISSISTVLSVTTLDNTTGPVVLHEAFFESGWDNWVDGGSDCYRYSGARSYEGSNSIRLRDNSGTASTMTSETFDLTPFSSVDFNFHFYSHSMESGENFIVQYYDGSTWATIGDYSRGTDFSNSSFYSIALNLDSASYTFVSNSQFRIQCDASGNADHIYIDQISIIGNSGSTAKSNSGKLEEVSFIAYKDTSFESDIEDVRLYPNPVSSSVLSVTIDSDYVNYNIFNSLGQLVKKGTLNNQKLQIGDLQSGIYVLHLSDGESKVYKKFIKE